MLVNIGVGCLLVVLTTVVHASAMVAAVRGLKLARAGRWTDRSGLTKVAVVAAMVVMMFLASFLEAALWAATYLVVGAMSDFAEALYFSNVTYTTLGFGDVVMNDDWRLLSSLQAANGIIMFGWTTALIVAAVHRVYIVETLHGIKP